MFSTKSKAVEPKKVSVMVEIGFALKTTDGPRLLAASNALKPQVEKISGKSSHFHFSINGAFSGILFADWEEREVPLRLNEIRKIEGIGEVVGRILVPIPRDDLTAKNGSVAERRKIAKSTKDKDALETLARDRYVTKEIKQNPNLTDSLRKVVDKTNNIKQAIYSIGFGMALGGPSVIFTDFIMRAEPIRYAIGDKNFDTVVYLGAFSAIGLGMLYKALKYDR